MTFVFSNDLIGMTELGERSARAMIPPLRGPTRHNSARQRKDRAASVGMTEQEKANPRPTRKTGVWGTRRLTRQEKERFLTSRTPFGMTGCCDCAEMGRSSAAPLQNPERRVCEFSP
jgi:hypothetical protein